MSLACAVAAEGSSCVLWWFDEVHIPASMGKAINLDVLFLKTEGHMDYQNLKRKSDHVKGSFPSFTSFDALSGKRKKIY